MRQAQDGELRDLIAYSGAGCVEGRAGRSAVFRLLYPGWQAEETDSWV